MLAVGMTSSQDSALFISIIGKCHSEFGGILLLENDN